MLDFRGYDSKSYLLDFSCPRFGSGEAKCVLKESVRGSDIFAMVDVTNYSLTYQLCGEVNHMSPDNHYQDLKRLIGSCRGARRVNVVMPFLYEGRQHKRTRRESLDCALALEELIDMGVSNIITFDAHDPRVQNAIPLHGFDNFTPPYQFIKALLKKEPKYDNRQGSFNGKSALMKVQWDVLFTLLITLALTWVCSIREETILLL